MRTGGQLVHESGLDASRHLFACPSCRSPLAFETSYLTCVECAVTVPIVDGFVVWAERFIDPAAAAARAGEIADGRTRYLELLERKFARRIYEPYAWFRPFNESSRSLEAFRELLTNTIEPGGAILDTWCRTGWTGEMLASWFPDSQVISLWEGDHDHLGYQGFMHWLPPHERAANLTVVFAHPDEPLPFADNAFAFVHGLDTLHRYKPSPLVGECLRVATDDAPLIFPHIHLTNSEPEPFFERGCTQLHGKTWGSFLDRLTANTDRRAWVLAEQDLYLLDTPAPLADDRSTAHYNGFAALGPTSWTGASLNKPAVEPAADAYLFSNPLVTVDSATGRAWIDRQGFSGTAGHMIDRHPVALHALEPATNRRLTSIECQIMAHAVTPQTCADVAARLDMSVDALTDQCRQLVAENVLQLERVSPAMARLQGHYRTLSPERTAGFAGLWDTLAVRYASTDVLHGSDGSVLGFDDANALVQASRHWLAERGLEPGDRVAFLADNHLEYAIMVWACWLSGLVVVPLSPDLSAAHLDDAVSAAAVAAIVCDAANRDRVDQLGSKHPVVVFDPPDDAAVPPNSFIDEVGPHIDRDHLGAIAGDDSTEAAVLFTSGTSGPPKAVRLSMGSLLHTSAVLGDVLGLEAGDRLLSLAAAYTMSGLRNPFLMTLRRGATLIVAPESNSSALAVVEACRKHQVSVLATSPILIDRVRDLADRIDPRSLQAVRVIATTADQLDAGAAAAVAELHDVQIIDYYGLTETGGVVLAAAPEARGNLGWPVGAAVEVHRDDDRAPHGTTGEIRVSGPSLMTGYLGSTSGVRFDGGWVYTGDLGVAHDDGSISLLGRIGTQLKRRTGEIYPHERVVTALTGRNDVHHVSPFVDPATRHVVLEVMGGDLEERELRDWIEQQCGAECLPDRFDMNPEAGDD